MSESKDYTDFLLNKLIHSGFKINEKLARDFLSVKVQTTSHLVQIAKNDDYWHSNNVQERIAPITALHILSLIKDKSCLDTIVYAFSNYYEELDDWGIMIPYLLANFGIEYYESLSELLLDTRTKPWTKECIAITLVIISKSDIGKEVVNDNTSSSSSNSSNTVNYTQRTIELLKRIITAKETDRDLKGGLVRILADLKDPSSLDFIKSLFDNHKIDKKIIKYSKVLDIYKGKYDKFIKVFYSNHSVLDYFKTADIPLFPHNDMDTNAESNSQESFTFLNIEDNNPGLDFNLVNNNSSTHSDTNSVVTTSSIDKRIESNNGESEVGLIDNVGDAVAQQTVTRSKTGRNEPCPCGSGKKYKKCCMNKK
jgi:hypothetical protein